MATVSGNLQDAGGGPVSSRTFVRFWLRGCANNQPRVNGVALIVPPGGPGYYKDFTPDAGGAIAGNIYRNSEIECNGATGNTWYGVQVYRDGKPGPETPYSVVAATFNLNTATPTVQAPPPPPATFPYIMANPIAAQTISNFPLNFGSGSGIGANYQGGVQAAGTYLRSNGASMFAPASASQIATDLLTTPTLNGLVYWNGSGLRSSPTGGAGTMCATSSNGGAPAWSSCAGSASTSWSALSAPSANLSLNMGQRTTNFSWGTGTGGNDLLFLDGAAGNGSGYTLEVKGQSGGSARILGVYAAAGAQVFDVSDNQISVSSPLLINNTLTANSTTVFKGITQVVDLADNTKGARFNTAPIPSGTLATIGQAVTDTASMDFDLSASGVTCQDLSITVFGANDGDAVSIGIPNGLASAAGIVFSAWVSASNTVTVRACDVTAGNPNPAAATIRAVVWKF